MQQLIQWPIAYIASKWLTLRQVQDYPAHRGTRPFLLDTGWVDKDVWLCRSRVYDKMWVLYMVYASLINTRVLSGRHAQRGTWGSIWFPLSPRAGVRLWLTEFGAHLRPWQDKQMHQLWPCLSPPLEVIGPPLEARAYSFNIQLYSLQVRNLF